MNRQFDCRYCKKSLDTEIYLDSHLQLSIDCKRQYMNKFLKGEHPSTTNNPTNNRRFVVEEITKIYDVITNRQVSKLTLYKSVSRSTTIYSYGQLNANPSVNLREQLQTFNSSSNNLSSQSVRMHSFNHNGFGHNQPIYRPLLPLTATESAHTSTSNVNDSSSNPSTSVKTHNTAVGDRDQEIYRPLLAPIASDSPHPSTSNYRYGGPQNCIDSSNNLSSQSVTKQPVSHIDVGQNQQIYGSILPSKANQIPDSSTSNDGYGGTQNGIDYSKNITSQSVTMEPVSHVVVGQNQQNYQPSIGLQLPDPSTSNYRCGGPQNVIYSSNNLSSQSVTMQPVCHIVVGQNQQIYQPSIVLQLPDPSTSNYRYGGPQNGIDYSKNITSQSVTMQPASHIVVGQNQQIYQPSIGHQLPDPSTSNYRYGGPQNGIYSTNNLSSQNVKMQPVSHCAVGQNQQIDRPPLSPISIEIPDPSNFRFGGPQNDIDFSNISSTSVTSNAISDTAVAELDQQIYRPLLAIYVPYPSKSNYPYSSPQNGNYSSNIPSTSVTKHSFDEHRQQVQQPQPLHKNQLAPSADGGDSSAVPVLLTKHNFKCSICNVSFLSNDAYCNHMRLQHKVVYNRCDRCDFITGTLVRLKMHIKTHEPIGKRCGICGKICKEISDSSDDLKSCRENGYHLCRRCTMLFGSKAAVIRYLAANRK